MADLTNQAPKDAFESLLTLDTNSISTTYKRVEDGGGVDTGLQLKTNAVKVDLLEFENTPATLTPSSTKALVNDSGTVKQVDIHVFGQSQTDPYNGFWEFNGTYSNVMPATTDTLIINDATGDVESTYAPSDLILTDVYDETTGLFMAGIGAGNGYSLTMELSITTPAGWVAADPDYYVEVGINRIGGNAPTDFVKKFRIDTVNGVEKITYSLEHYVDSSTSTNGFAICATAYGDAVVCSAQKTFLRRTRRA